MRRKMILLSGLITCVIAAVGAGAAAIAAPAAPAGADLLASTQPVLPAPGGLDHFKCYTPLPADSGQLARVPFPVGLRDQFGAIKVSVARQPDRLCNPAKKEHNGVVTDITNPLAHLVCHPVRLAPGSSFTPRTVGVENQFGVDTLDVTKVLMLCLPSFKRKDTEPPFSRPLPQQPGGLSHFLCYEARTRTPQPPPPPFPPTIVTLSDQFGGALTHVGDPVTLCNPVEKTRPNGKVTGVINPQAHLVCDRLFSTLPDRVVRVQVKHQFGRFPLTSGSSSELCVPSSKKEIPAPTPTPAPTPPPPTTPPSSSPLPPSPTPFGPPPTPSPSPSLLPSPPPIR